MKRAFIVLALLSLLAASCRRQDVRTITIAVPDLRDDRSARIVADALVCELARNDANLSVDLKEHTVSVSANNALTAPALQRRILESIQAVGFTPKLVGVKPSPVDSWRDRHILTLRVPELQNNRTANIAVGAVSRAMVGPDMLDRIRLDPAAHTVTVTHDSMQVARMNLEQAIANAGFRTQNEPANLGFPDALPHGWSPQQ
jgi:hypothetical protein